MYGTPFLSETFREILAKFWPRKVEHAHVVSLRSKYIARFLDLSYYFTVRLYRGR